MNKFFSGLLLLLALLSACRTLKISPKKIKTQKVSFLNKKIEENRIDCKTFGGKAKVQLVSPDQSSKSFNATLRIKKDSLIWISIAPALGIEVSRLSITPDSLMVLDRLKKKYLRSSFKALSQKFSIPMDFYTLQELILGNAVEVREKVAVSSVDSNFHLIVMENELQQLKVWLEPEKFLLHQVKMKDKVNHQKMILTLSGYKAVNDKWFAYDRGLRLQQNQEFSAKISFTNAKFDVAQKYPFTIPSKYESIQ